LPTFRLVRPRALGFFVAAGVSAALVFAAAAPATAAAVITPSAGPTTGGTTVSLSASTLGFAQIAQGQDMGYGLSGDGHIYAWGQNGSGQLGNGGTTASNTPVRVLQGAIPAGVTITQIAAGWQSGYALANNGTLYAWGTNFRGQLGDGTTTARNQPVAVDLSALGAGVVLTRIVAGGFDAYALSSDGAAYAWGLGNDGELGNGANSDSSTPVAVDTTGMPAGVDFSDITTGQVAAYALGTDGKVYSWGSDVAGALGTGGTGDLNVPTAISAGALPVGVTITRVAAGQEGGYALGDDGHVYAWGSNMFGDLGDGTNTDSNVPVQVSAGAIPAGVNITAIGGGSSSAYGIGSDGHVYAWGNGGNGQLGDGLGTSSSAPVLVAAGAIPTDVLLTSVSGGYHSAIALGNDGKVYGWGDNNGDLGDGTAAQRVTPALGANATVSAVTFGGVAGTNVVDPPGVTTVVTPAHAAGVVDVAVAGSINGGATTGIATSRVFLTAFTFQLVLAATGLAFPWWLLWAGCAAIAIGAVTILRRGGRAAAGVALQRQRALTLR
jgi:alpha-tubulin suppressor-like RCC1 family protein